MPEVQFERLAPMVLLVRGAEGDSTPDNGGATSNVLIARAGPRVWTLGSGPTAEYAARLACWLQARWHWTITDVVAPWGRPELVLGASGLPRTRLWAHEAVADYMQAHCDRCARRLNERLERPASADTPEPRLPDHVVSGMHGELGPWQWWLLHRDDDVPFVLWRLQGQPLWSAPGMLWADGAPDLRDASLVQMQTATAQAVALSADDGASARWVPEQGPVQDAGAPRRSLDYWRGLEDAVRAAQRAGALDTAPPPALDLPLSGGPRHALNWQRAWRQIERIEFGL